MEPGRTDDVEVGAGLEAPDIADRHIELGADGRRVIGGVRRLVADRGRTRGVLLDLAGDAAVAGDELELVRHAEVHAELDALDLHFVDVVHDAQQTEVAHQELEELHVVDLGREQRGLVRQAAIGHLALEADLRGLRGLLVVVVADDHRAQRAGARTAARAVGRRVGQAATREAVDEEVDGSGGPGVVEAAALEADAPVGIRGQVVRGLPGQRDLRLELGERLGAVGDGAVRTQVRVEGRDQRRVERRIADEGVVERVVVEVRRAGGDRHQVLHLALLVVVAQGQRTLDAVGDVVRQVREAGVHIAGEVVPHQLLGAVRLTARHVQRAHHADVAVDAGVHADLTVDVEGVDARQPAEALVAVRLQTQLEAVVLLVAHLVLRAVTARGGVRTPDRGGRRRPELDLRRGHLEARVEELGRRGDAVRLVPEEAVGGAGAVRPEVVLDVAVERPRGQLAERGRLVPLRRDVERLLVVEGVDVVDELEVVLVHILVEELRVRQARTHEARHEEHGVERDGRGLDLAVTRLDIERRGVGRLEHEAGIDVEAVVVVDRAVVEETVLVEAVRLAVVGGDLPAGGVGDGSRQHDRTGRHAVLAQADLGAAREHVGRLGGGDDAGAGSRVTAVDRALRALHDLDLLEVGVLAVEGGRVGLQHAVDDQREAVLGIAGTVDAADVDLRIGHFGGLHERHARREADEVARALHCSGLERVGGDGGDRCRHILQRFLTLTSRGDDHFLKDLFVGLLGVGGMAGQRCGDGRGDGQSDEMRLAGVGVHR